MAALMSIPIDCWICGTTYSVPAQLTILPPRYVTGPWYGKQVSANVWAYLNTTEINRHVADHWPVLVLWFFMWRAFVDLTGVDVLEYYAGRGND